MTYYGYPDWLARAQKRESERIDIKWVRLAFVSAILTFALSSLQGCGTPGYIRAEAIDTTVRGMVERHDAYTVSDPALSDLERRVYLRDGELLLQLLDEAQAPSEASPDE